MQNKGFSIPEIMIAIFVVTVGVLGIYALLPHIIGSIFENKDRFIASQLAREGFEIVRNIRDTNWLEDRQPGVSNDWDEDLTGCTAGCEVDYLVSEVIDPALDSWTEPGRYLKIDGNGFYSYSAGVETKFKRKVTIGAGTVDQLDITTTVFWNDNFLVIEERLYNWFPSE